MILSLENVIFQQNDTVQFINMQNTSQNALIFKIKVTHTNYFLISPPKGIIKVGEKALLTIKLIKNCDINAKLLINYAELEQISNQSIDLQLEKIDKQGIKNKIIPITRVSKKQKEEKKQQKATFKKTQSPIYEVEINEENNKKMDSSLKRSVALKSSSNMFRSVQDLDLDKKQSSCNSRTQQRKLQKELQYQRQLNRRMTERLLQRQKKIMYLNTARQLQINKSLENEEGKFEWSCCNLILIAFICIMIGFFLSKYDLPHTLTL